MRAIIYAGKGPSDVMRPAERPVPAPGPGQVRVRMVRAGVNPTDWKARAGVSSPMTFPEVTPGQDGAGVIDAVGAGVPGLDQVRSAAWPTTKSSPSASGA